MGKNLLWQLFSTFFKVGAFTFGGGWAMISIIEKEVVDKHKWIERDAFLDLLAVAQSLPGLFATNVAVSVGEKLRGKAGAAAAALGTILPSFLMILCIAIFLTPETINGNPTLSAIFKGIRPAVVALIIAPVINSAKSAKLNWKTAMIPVVAALTIWSRVPYISSPILWILLGGIGGYIVYSRSMKSVNNDAP